MSHMNSVRGPATMIFTALMVLILVSSSRTTYRFGPAAKENTRAALSTAAPPSSAEIHELRRFCPWPRRMWNDWTHEAEALGDSR